MLSSFILEAIGKSRQIPLILTYMPSLRSVSPSLGSRLVTMDLNNIITMDINQISTMDLDKITSIDSIGEEIKKLEMDQPSWCSYRIW